ncbi:MAG: hypothetical protein HY289_05885 [Planctomycetes bacterium]|nr:hypothetical protein [Planctomycetota bacterium]
MPDFVKYIIDATAAAGLFFALLIVFAVDWFIARPAANTLENVKVIQDSKGASKKLKLAVTKTQESTDGITGKVKKWDDMGKLLTGLGEGYAFDEITDDQVIKLHQDKKLNEYDVLFLTCRPPGDVDKMIDPLQTYVANGGILYASDYRYENLAAAFKDMAQPSLVADGIAQPVVEADIVDADLSKAIDAKKIKLKFDMGDWKAAAFGGPGTQVLIKGTYKKKGPGQPLTTAPLMVRFTFGKGTVIFTSFHNEAQNSRIEEMLLQYLVFSLVTAGIDAELNASMEKGGFAPQGSNLLSTPKKDKIEKTYDNPQVCTLRFALGFRNEGYKLRFNIKSPSGQQFTQDCDGTTILEVANAERGTWKYTVEAKDAYANFAFRTSVGEKK